MNIISGIQTIATGFNLDHIPVSDEMISHAGSSVWTAAGAPLDTPRMNVGITDGALTAWFLTSGNIRGWTGPRRLYISPTNYLRLNNPAGGGDQNLSYDGDIQRPGAVSNVISGLVSLAPGIATVVRPPVGQCWHITDFGSDQWVGILPTLPNLRVELIDNVNAVIVVDGTNSKLWFTESMGLYIDNATYIRITNTSIGQATVGWSGIISRPQPATQRMTRSALAVVLAGGTLDIAPINTREEWLVTGIYSSNLFGIAPDQFPDVNVEANNGVIASLQARNSDAPLWLHHPNIPVSSTRYITITDTSGIGGTLGYSAILTKVGL